MSHASFNLSCCKLRLTIVSVTEQLEKCSVLLEAVVSSSKSVTDVTTRLEQKVDDKFEEFTETLKSMDAQSAHVSQHFYVSQSSLFPGSIEDFVQAYGQQLSQPMIYRLELR